MWESVFFNEGWCRKLSLTSFTRQLNSMIIPNHLKECVLFSANLSIKGEAKFPSNYHLTFSRSENNDKKCEMVLLMGGNVAVVFRNQLPKTWKGFEVVNGDETDLRFLDKKGVVVGLIEKGMAKKDATGFVVEGIDS